MVFTNYLLTNFISPPCDTIVEKLMKQSYNRLRVLFRYLAEASFCLRFLFQEYIILVEEPLPFLSRNL